MFCLYCLDLLQSTHPILMYFILVKGKKDTAKTKEMTVLINSLKMKRAKRIAKRFVVTLDRSIGYLGPDYELLTDVLQVLGQKHKKYGVTSAHFIQMGNALIETLEDVLGGEDATNNNKFPHDVKQSWIEVYQLFSGEMLNA